MPTAQTVIVTKRSQRIQDNPIAAVVIAAVVITICVIIGVGVHSATVRQQHAQSCADLALGSGDDGNCDDPTITGR